MQAPYTREDLNALLGACAVGTAKGLRDRALVLTLLDTGLRAAEVVSLRVGDVNMRTGVAVVMGKGRKQRQVRVGSKARSAILRYLAARPSAIASDLLWTGYNRHGMKESGRLDVHGLQTFLVRLGVRAGVYPCAPHRFRRTFALWCLRDGCDLHSLRLMMGHADLTVLQRYLALSGEDIERAHRAHSPADKML